MALSDLPVKTPPWVFGFKKRLRISNQFKDVANIILNKFSRIPKRPQTVEAEWNLGIMDSWYMYIGKSHDAYGNGIFFFYVDNANSTMSDKGACPFDSGGLWREYIHTNPTLVNDNEKKSFFNSHDKPLHIWDREFKEYIINNYSDYALYVAGNAPDVGNGIPEIIKNTPPNYSQAWTWEGRFEKANTNSVKVLAFICTNRKLNLIIKELILNAYFTSREKEIVHKWLKESQVVSPTSQASVSVANNLIVSHGI